MTKHKHKLYSQILFLGVALEGLLDLIKTIIDQGGTVSPLNTAYSLAYNEDTLSYLWQHYLRQSHFSLRFAESLENVANAQSRIALYLFDSSHVSFRVLYSRSPSCQRPGKI